MTEHASVFLSIFQKFVKFLPVRNSKALPFTDSTMNKKQNKTINFGCRVESHHKIERILRIHKMLGADEKCGKKRTRRIEELKFLSLSSPNWLRMKTI